MNIRNIRINVSEGKIFFIKRAVKHLSEDQEKLPVLKYYCYRDLEHVKRYGLSRMKNAITAKGRNS